LPIAALDSRQAVWLGARLAFLQATGIIARGSLELVHKEHLNIYLCKLHSECLQCFDAVGWAAGRASGL